MPPSTSLRQEKEKKWAASPLILPPATKERGYGGGSSAEDLERLQLNG